MPMPQKQQMCRFSLAAAIAAIIFFPLATKADTEFGSFKCCLLLNAGKTEAASSADVKACFPMIGIDGCEKYKATAGAKVVWREKPCPDLVNLCAGRPPAGCCKFGTPSTFVCVPSPDSAACDAFTQSTHWFLNNQCNLIDECKDKIAEIKTYESAPASAGAATEKPAKPPPPPIIPQLSVKIPNLSPFTAPGGSFTQGYIIPYIGQYISAVYAWALGLVSVLAVAMIAWAGIKWQTAGADASRVESAKATITNAAIGLVMALSSYLVLWTLNPKLVEFQALKIDVVPTIAFDPSIETQLGGVSIESANQVASAAAPPTGNVPVFKQAGAPWGNKVYGNCPTTDIDPRDIP